MIFKRRRHGGIAVGRQPVKDDPCCLMHQPSDTGTRPQFGQLQRSDGTLVPLLFEASPEDPTAFVPCNAVTGEPVTISTGDTVNVDAIGPGQRVQMAWEPS